MPYVWHRPASLAAHSEKVANQREVLDETAMNTLPTWQQEREQTNRRVDALRQAGVCPTCDDLQTDGQLYGNEHILYEDGLFKVALERYARARGHTIVVYKPHRADLSELSDAEAGHVFAVCVRVVQDLKQALGAEKVYLNTMCDGGINHLHLQLFPRYSGERIGSTRFVAERRPIVDGGDTVRRIRSVLKLPINTGQLPEPPSPSRGS
jgi:histidine triad (HIT) family protein